MAGASYRVAGRLVEKRIKGPRGGDQAGRVAAIFYIDNER